MTIMNRRQLRGHVRNFLVGLNLSECRRYRAQMRLDGTEDFVDEFIRELEAELDGPVSGNDYNLPHTD